MLQTKTRKASQAWPKALSVFARKWDQLDLDLELDLELELELDLELELELEISSFSDIFGQTMASASDRKAAAQAEMGSELGCCTTSP